MVGHGPLIEREQGAAATLRQLGAEVRGIDLWDDPLELLEPSRGEQPVRLRAIVFEALSRPDLASAALRRVRREPTLREVGALLAVTVGQIARVEPAEGFDDFVLCPYVPEELYARIRALEWRKSEFGTEERYKVGSVVVDRAAQQVTVAGRPVALTTREFALLAFLCERRGKVSSRQQLLVRVWGARYEGGERTVDIHVRRLRAKLGEALPLETLRGAGYVLRAPSTDDLTASSPPSSLEEPD